LVILEIDNTSTKDSSKSALSDNLASSLDITRLKNEELLCDYTDENGSTLDIDFDSDGEDEAREASGAISLPSWHVSDSALSSASHSSMDSSEAATNESESVECTPPEAEESSSIFASKNEVIFEENSVFSTQASSIELRDRSASGIDSEINSIRDELRKDTIKKPGYRGVLDVAGEAIRTTNLKTFALGQKGTSSFKSFIGLQSSTVGSAENSSRAFSQYVPPGETVLEYYMGHILFGMEMKCIIIVLTDRSIHILDEDTMSAGLSVKDPYNWLTPSRAESSASAEGGEARSHSSPQSTSLESVVLIPSRSKLSSALVSVMINTDVLAHSFSNDANCVIGRISYGDVVGVHRRRFLLAHKAVEMFMLSGRSIFLALRTVEEKNSFCSLLMRRCNHIPGLDMCLSTEHDDDLLATTPLGITPMSAGWFARQRKAHGNPAPTEPLHLESLYQARERWVNGLMTNFEYLMTLNSFSGRSYNDWTQYPVFPWVLQDYTSSKLDLNDSSVFRDLRKPMGALNPLREREARKKFDDLMQQFKETRAAEAEGDPGDATEAQIPSIPPFHYGTHYSSAAGLLYYMVLFEAVIFFISFLF
jgi:hypothetical protein